MIQGIYASNQGIVGDRVGDFASAMLQVNPNGSALLLALTSGMAKEGATDTVVNWFEDIHQSMRTQITSAALSTDTAVQVADGTLYVPNQILLVEQTGEILRVSAVNGNILTVTRGMAGTTPQALTTVMYVQGIGNAQPEASSMPTAVTQQGKPRSNYTQIFRNSWAVSGTAKVVNFRTGNKVAKNKSDCANYHAEDIERAFLWGQKHTGTINGSPFRLTDGILTQISQYGGLVTSANSLSVAGQLMYVDFEDFLRQVFARNIKGQPNERIAFCGDIALLQFNKMARFDSVFNIETNETSWGIKVTTIICQFGTLKLMTHPLMVESPYRQSQLIVLHPGGIKKRVLREPNEEGYDKNGQRISGIDADQGVITSEMAVTVGAAQTMGIFNNIVKGIKSQ